jgi:pilus assembly protein CpaE
VSVGRSIIVVEPDPYLAVSVETLVEGVHPPPELIAVADTDELRDWARPTGVLVAGPSCTKRQAIDDLIHFRDMHPAVRVVLAFDRRPGAPMRDVIAIGADSLVDPREEGELKDAVLRAIDLSDRLGHQVSAAAAEEPTTTDGKIFTVCSATGGCGKTFYSTNLAFALSRWTGKKVALIDLDLQFGEVVTAIRLRAQQTISDVIAIEDDAELDDYLPEMLTAHEAGVFVLPAPGDPAEADNIRPQDVLRVLDAAQRHYDYVIVDTPTGLGEAVLAALDRSEHLFVLAALDLPSVRNLRLFLQTMDRLRIPTDDISVLLNKDQTGVGIDAGQVEKLFPGGFRAKIPFDREVPKSMNLGVPVVFSNPTGQVAQQIMGSMLPWVPASAAQALRDELARSGSKSVFKRWRQNRRGRRTNVDMALAEEG